MAFLREEAASIMAEGTFMKARHIQAIGKIDDGYP